MFLKRDSNIAKILELLFLLSLLLLSTFFDDSKLFQRFISKALIIFFLFLAGIFLIFYNFLSYFFSFLHIDCIDIIEPKHKIRNREKCVRALNSKNAQRELLFLLSLAQNADIFFTSSRLALKFFLHVSIILKIEGENRQSLRFCFSNYSLFCATFAIIDYRIFFTFSSSFFCFIVEVKINF